MQHFNYLLCYILVIMLMAYLPQNCLAGETAGCMIRISGKILEQSSQKPLKQARILVRHEGKVLAVGNTQKDGSFVLYIPPEKITSRSLDIKVVYMDHVFVQHNVFATSQEMLIEINGSLLLKDEFFDEHKLPVHSLNEPQVGKVTISSPDHRLDPNAISRDEKSQIGI